MRIMYQTTVRFFVFDWCRWKKKKCEPPKIAMNPKFGPTVVDITPRKHAQVRNFMNVTSSDTKLHLYDSWLVLGYRYSSGHRSHTSDCGLVMGHGCYINGTTTTGI